MNDLDGISDDSHDPPGAVKIDQISCEFLLKDFELRRTDILQRVDRIEQDIKQGVLVIGGIWAWLFTDPNIDNPNLKVLLYSIPLLLNAFFYLKFYVQDRAIKLSGKYIHDLETLFLKQTADLPDQGVFGWENYLEHNNLNKNGKLARDLLYRHNHLLWSGLMIVNVMGFISLGIY